MSRELIATRADAAERLVAVSKLAEAKNHAVGAGQLETYLEDLADVPTALLLAAVARLRKASTFGFPTVAAIREMVDTVQREAAVERAKALPPASDDEDRRRWVNCPDCQDDPGAWRSVWCPGRGKAVAQVGGEFERTTLGHALQNCDRTTDHAPHGYVVRCGCHRAEWREARRKLIRQKYSEDRKSA